jgi:hypothetical protein
MVFGKRFERLLAQQGAHGIETGFSTGQQFSPADKLLLQKSFDGPCDDQSADYGTCGAFATGFGQPPIRPAAAVLAVLPQSVSVADLGSRSYASPVLADEVPSWWSLPSYGMGFASPVANWVSRRYLVCMVRQPLPYPLLSLLASLGTRCAAAVVRSSSARLIPSSTSSYIHSAHPPLVLLVRMHRSHATHHLFLRRPLAPLQLPPALRIRYPEEHALGTARATSADRRQWGSGVYGPPGYWATYGLVRCRRCCGVRTYSTTA